MAPEGLAAARRSISLENENWRHHLRLAYVSWGDERLRAARHALKLLPGFAFGHWQAATVHVARGALDEAERELEAGTAAQGSQLGGSRFGTSGPCCGIPPCGIRSGTAAGRVGRAVNCHATDRSPDLGGANKWWLRYLRDCGTAQA